jgi:hypothetical protein
VPTDFDVILSTIHSWPPLESVDHRLEENFSQPSAAFTAHVPEDVGILDSGFDFSDLPTLMLAMGHSVTTSPQSTLQNQLFPMGTAAGFYTSGPQTIGSANFINFPAVGCNVKRKDKRSIGVCSLIDISYALMTTI